MVGLVDPGRDRLAHPVIGCTAGHPTLKCLPYDVARGTYAIGLPPAGPELEQAIDAALAAMRADGELERILIEAIGLALAKDLESYAIASATELVAVKDSIQCEIPEAAAAKLRDAARRVAERLAADPRVETVKFWLAGAVSEVRRPPIEPLQMRAAVGEAIQQQIESTLLSSDVVVNLQGKTGAGIRQVLVDAAQQMKGKIARSSFLTIDLSEFAIAPSELKLPFSAYDDFKELSDDIYLQLSEKVGVYQYGGEWALKNAQGELLKHAREITGQPLGRAVMDRRTLGEVGIHPGDRLTAVRLQAA